MTADKILLQIRKISCGNSLKPHQNNSARKMKNKLKGALVAICCSALAACTGEGLDAKLDAAKGFDVNYQATLSKAFEKMTGDQRGVYNWAVENLTDGQFVAKYGKEPTVREVMKGQIKMANDANEEAILNQMKLIEGSAAEIAERTRLRKEARQLLQSISATGTVARSTKTQTICEGVVCSETQPVVVDVVVSNPKSIKLKRLQCSAIITPAGGSTTYTYKLWDECSDAGDWVKSITLPAGVSFDGAKVDVTFDFENAEVDYGNKAIPESLEVTKTMADLEDQQAYIRKAKVLVQ
jgi:hypothetical protein